jgi:WD40 repeat protein
VCRREETEFHFTNAFDTCAASSLAGIPTNGRCSRPERYPIVLLQFLHSGQSSCVTPLALVDIGLLTDCLHSESGKHLAISTSDLNIHLLSSLTLSTIWRLKNAHAFPGTCLAFDPSGDLLVSGSADMTLRVIKVGLDQEPAIVYNLIHSKSQSSDKG